MRHRRALSTALCSAHAPTTAATNEKRDIKPSSGSRRSLVIQEVSQVIGRRERERLAGKDGDTTKEVSKSQDVEASLTLQSRLLKGGAGGE